MSFDRSVRYPTKWLPPSASFPFGVPKNSTTETSKDGVPFEKDFISDTEGFFQGMLLRRNISLSGNPDTALISDYLDALGLMVGITHETLAAVIADTTLKVGMQVTTQAHNSSFSGGGGNYLVVLASSVTLNTFDIIVSVGVPTLAVVLQVPGGRVSTSQLGTTKSGTDYLALIHAANNPDWTHILIENYSPSGGLAHVDRNDVIFDGLNKLIDFTGVAHPMLVHGETSGGGDSPSSRINITVQNIKTTGDKTVGSRVVKFRTSSTCTFKNWRASGLETPFDAIYQDGSIACEFYNMDFRGNTYGFLDLVGGFQGSTFFGGRIEQNDINGVYTKTTNLNFVGTVIEGNNVDDNFYPEVRSLGGGSLNFTNVYFEINEISRTNPPAELVKLDDESTKRVNFVNCDMYGNNDLSNRTIVSCDDWIVGGASFVGCNINAFDKFCARNGLIGNWLLSIFGNFENTLLDDPADSLNGAAFTINSRVSGFKASNISAIDTVFAKRFQVQEAGSLGFSREFHRFIGRVSVGGAGDWHQVIELDEVSAGASTSIRFDLYFSERAGDFQFYTTIMLEGTTTLKTKEDVSGNWTSSLYRINAGFLEVDNLPASNRDWTCRIVAIKATLS